MSLQQYFVRLLDLIARDPSQARFIEDGLKSIKSSLIDFSLNPIQDIPSKPEPSPFKKRKEIFNYKTCDAYALLTEKFGANIKHQELIMIASKAAKMYNLKVDRDAKRRKDLLFKWFQEHLKTIEPMLKTTLVFDKNGSILNTRDNVVFVDESIDGFRNESV